MKIWILGLLVVVILAVYAIPTFYEAGKEKKILKTARIIAEDIMNARSLSLSKVENYGIALIRTGRQGYKVFDSKDKVIKTVYLDQMDPDVVYSSFFEGKGAAIEKDTFIFKPVRDISASEKSGNDSIFLNDRIGEDKKDISRVIRIYIDKDSYSIKLFRVYETNDKGDLVFKEI